MFEPHAVVRVGPVFQKCEAAEAMVGAIRRQNEGVTVHDGGAYLRVRVSGLCLLDRKAAEELLGRPLRFPGDLEKVMPAFQGRLTISEDAARWEAKRP